MQSLLRSFFRRNQEICASLEKHLPADFKRHLFTSYKRIVADYIDASKTSLTVLDVGGGKECPYFEFTKTADNHTIIAVDIDEHELQKNHRCRSKVVADATSETIPFAASSADMMTSRSVLEHLRDNVSFVGNCRRVLRRDGILISTFPCRRSPFALINKLLPDRVARAILYYFHPQWRDVCGFKVFYNRCTYAEMRRLLEANGFDMVHCELRYYQAIYFDFFLPLYVLMLLYDLSLWWIDARRLCCQMLFVARKRGI